MELIANKITDKRLEFDHNYSELVIQEFTKHMTNELMGELGEFLERQIMKIDKNSSEQKVCFYID